MIADLLFLLFASVLLVGALGVITAKNPMYCVLFLLLTFFNAAGLFILIGAEFLALLLVMIYVGAIAVMFLFVVMTIDQDFTQLREGFATYLPAGLLVGAILLIELIAVILYLPAPVVDAAVASQTDTTENIKQLGHVLFTAYALPFLTAGMILLVAMLGAIVLTHRKRGDVLRQNIRTQMARQKHESVALTQPKIGAGATAEHWVGRGVE